MPTPDQRFELGPYDAATFPQRIRHAAEDELIRLRQELCALKDYIRELENDRAMRDPAFALKLEARRR